MFEIVINKNIWTWTKNNTYDGMAHKVDNFFLICQTLVVGHVMNK